MAFKVGAIVSQLKLDKSGWDQSVNKVKADQKSLGASIAANGPKFQAMGRAMTFAGAAVIGSLGLMIKKFIDAGDWIDKMTYRTGFSATALSELAYAADISGASLGDVEKGVKRMASAIIDANDGLAESVRAFDSMGLSIADLMSMNPEQQFLAITEAIADLEDPTLRAALAQDVFGRAGTTLLPLMAQGKEGLINLREEAHKLGIVFDQEAAAKAAKLKDAQTALNDSVKGVGFAIATQLVPAIIPLVQKLTDTISKVSAWIKENPKLTETIAKLALGAGALMTVLGPILMVLPGIVVALGAGGTASGVAGAASKLIPILHGLAGAVAAVAWLKFLQSTDKLTWRLMEGLNPALKTLRERMKNAASDANAFAESLEYVDVSAKELKKRYKALEEGGGEWAKSVKDLDDKLKAEAKSTGELEDKLKKVDAQYKRHQEDYKKLHPLMTTYIDDTDTATIAVDGILAKTSEWRTEVLDFPTIMENAAWASENWADRTYWAIANTAIPAARDFSDILTDFGQDGQDSATEIKTAFDTMTDGLKTKWASAFGEMLRGATSFKDSLKGLWDGVFGQFTDTLGSMFSEFLAGGQNAFAGLTQILTSPAGFIAACYLSVKAIWAVGGALSDFLMGAGLNDNWEEQKKRLDEYLQKWLDLGYSIKEATDRFNEWLNLTGQTGGDSGKGGGGPSIRDPGAGNRPGWGTGGLRPGFASGAAFVPDRPIPILVHPNELVDITPMGELRSSGRSRAGLSFAGAGAGGGQIVFSPTINISAMDSQDVERLFRNKGNDIFQDMVRGNLNGLAQNIEKKLSEYRG